MRFAVCLFSGLLAAAVAGCGGSGGGNTCSPGTSFTLTISSAGVSPTNACIQPGNPVTFKNSDTVTHTVSFTPAAGSTTCPPSKDIAAGQSEDIPFPTTTQCTYAVSGLSAASTGTVVATNVVQSGGGY